MIASGAGLADGVGVGLGLASVLGLVSPDGVCCEAVGGAAHAAATKIAPTERTAQTLLTTVRNGEVYWAIEGFVRVFPITGIP